MPLEFLNAAEAVDTAVAPEVAPEPQPEPAPQAEAPAEQPRGPDGKFAPKEPAPAPEPEPEPVVAAQPEPPPAPLPATEPQIPPGFVPVSALSDERNKRQAVEAQLQALQRPAAPPAQRREPTPAPDPFEDFDAYQAWEQEQRAGERAAWSERLAVAVHGQEMVEKVKGWASVRAEADPVFRQQTAFSPDPYGLAVEEYQRHEALQMLTNPELRTKFQAFLNGQAQAPVQPAPAPMVAAPAAVAPPPSAPLPPPRSIAAAPSAGGPAAVPTGPGQAFDGVFNKG